jgi:hypothetical protein
MKSKLIIGIALTLLFAGMLTLVFNIQPVRAGEAIFIRADGSVDPDTAPISSDDNITYTFTGDITYPTYYGITVERSNITVDGNGYTLQGAPGVGGFRLSDVNSVTIKNTNITVGPWAPYEHPAGFELDNASYCTFFGNNITNLRYGVMAWSGSSINNTFYHNNFINNSLQVNIASDFANFWDNGYPSGGNYWSHLTKVDYFSGPNQDQPGSDGIGDSPYVITRVFANITNVDRYPLGGTSECVGTHDVAVTNVTISKTVVGQGIFMFVNVTVENQGESTETFGIVTPYGYGVVVPSSVRWKDFWGIGDVNMDGYINQTDADLIIPWFGQTVPPAPPEVDVNGDGVVSAADALICSVGQGLDIWAYYKLPMPPIGTQRGVRLVSGNQTTLTFAWNTTGVTNGSYTIRAYATPVPCETDFADNTYTAHIPVGGISIPVNKFRLLAAYIGLTILLAVAVISVVYVKKRKRHTETNSACMHVRAEKRESSERKLNKISINLSKT